MTQFITMNDLHEKLSSLGSKDLVLDVRTPQEFASGRVPGSKNIPFNEVEQHQKTLREYDRIYIYCQAGVRAQTAAAMLEKLGFTDLFCVSSAGMGQWIGSGYSVEK